MQIKFLLYFLAVIISTFGGKPNRIAVVSEEPPGHFRVRRLANTQCPDFEMACTSNSECSDCQIFALVCSSYIPHKCVDVKDGDPGRPGSNNS
jgi:hypothetical protein